MKRIFVFSLFLCLCLPFIPAKAQKTFHVTAVDGLEMSLNKNNTIALFHHIKRGIKYNSWYIYTIEMEQSGNLNLKGIAEVKDDERGEIFVANQKPGDLQISGITTNTPQMTGFFNSPLKEDSRYYHDKQWEMARSIVYYNKNPEMFSPDSVAKLKTNAYALVPSYNEIMIQISKNERQQKIAREEKSNRQNAWSISLIFIPLILTLFLAFTVDDANILQASKSIAIVQAIELPIFVIAFCSINTYWWMIVLAVIAFLAINAMNIFFFLSLKDHANESIGVKYPLLPATVFGYTCLVAIYSVVIELLTTMHCFNTTILRNTHYSVFEWILGITLTIALFVLLGWWYKSSLTKRASILGENFLPIAIITVMTAVAICCFILVIIALLIFTHTGRSFLNSSASASDSGLKTSPDSVQSCAHCALLGDSTCPYFHREGHVGVVCSSWMPK